MKLWPPPFWAMPADPPREDRQSLGYTDALVAQILAAANQRTVDARFLSGAEIAAGVVSRAFSLATVEGAMVPASFMNWVGRALVLDGQALFFLDGPELVPVPSAMDIAGGPRRSTWRYSFQLQSPTGTAVEYRAGASRVGHARYSYDAIRPWVGIPPLQRAAMTGDLATRLEQVLIEEFSAPVGHLLPVPVDASDASIDNLKSDLGNLRGRVSVVETMAAGWGEGRPMAPRTDYQPQRLGPNPPNNIGQVFNAVLLVVLAVCGVPVELVSSAEGTGQREAWRRCLHGTIAPLGRIVSEEFSRLYGRPVTISFRDLFAGDIAGRARAFQSLVNGGMDPARAAGLSGLMQPED